MLELEEKLIEHSANLKALCRMQAAPDDLDEFRRATAAAAKKKKRLREAEDHDSEGSTPASSVTSSPQKCAGC